MLTRFRAALFGCLMFAADGYGQTLEIPPTASIEPGGYLTITAKTDCTDVKWAITGPGLNLFPTQLLKDFRTAVVNGNTPGKYRVIAVGCKDNKMTEIMTCIVTIVGEVSPKPDPAPSPTPTPTPTPPTPPPIAGDGVKVMIVWDRVGYDSLPLSQKTLLSSAPLMEFMNKVTATEPSGMKRWWRIWANDEDVTGDLKEWRDAYEGAKKSNKPLPLILISNGKTGTVESLPLNIEKTIDLITKWEK